MPSAIGVSLITLRPEDVHWPAALRPRGCGRAGSARTPGRCGRDRLGALAFDGHHEPVGDEHASEHRSSLRAPPRPARPRLGSHGLTRLGLRLHPPGRLVLEQGLSPPDRLGRPTRAGEIRSLLEFTRSSERQPADRALSADELAVVRTLDDARDPSSGFSRPELCVLLNWPERRVVDARRVSSHQASSGSGVRL